MSEFNKILIANRGEIAVRIIRTAKNMGYYTVAVYSDADTHALHVQLADEAVHIGPSPVGESYLRIDNIIAAAKASGADAIHPGYGFLSENSDFAAACEENGICFIGPPAQAIELMGSKRQAKLAVEKAGVATVPGYDGAQQDIATLARHAAQIGTPLMIKASAGGGGRGMRLVEDLSQVEADLNSARSEAEHAFGNGELILERAVINPRHIEIQIFADQQGDCIHLGERDCSVQRRHQKVVEEAPSPFVSPALRKDMGAAAVKVAQLCNYVGAGTVEFLVDAEENFYFLEMNTRLQVEHPVTEMITHLDLVEWQLRIAAGEPLPLQQDQITLDGHAIEVRLYAEDAYQNFLPQTGRVHLWHTEPQHGVRVDSGVQSGTLISPFYDPMLAKIIAHGKDRATAIRKLDRALGNSVVLGTETNKPFLRQLITHNQFKSGHATTGFIAEHPADWLPANARDEQSGACLAAALLHSCGNHSGIDGTTRITLRGRRQSHLIRVEGDRVLTVTCGDRCQHIELHRNGPRATVRLHSVGQPLVSRIVYYHIDDQTLYKTLYLDNGFTAQQFVDITHAPPDKAAHKGSGKVLAPMDGNLMTIQVQPGDKVKQGDIVAVVEAMKMEHPLRATVSGQVEKVVAQHGDQLKARQLILLITEENNPE
ncbi:MAG TPA: 3-methylcrotonyl-CoA carboxylase [Gammaproteobacteria bacterium]|nr:3-methylcrotonyl-CoA carboxylase [Gammaproteobacteria bacterium]